MEPLVGERKETKEQEPEQLDGDFEVEITDLDASLSDVPGFQTILVKSGSLSRPYRAVMAAVTTGVMTLALVLLTAPPVQQWFTRAAQATPMVEPGLSFFTVQASPPWGHLF